VSIVGLGGDKWALDVEVDGESTTVIFAFAEPDGMDLEVYPAQAESFSRAAERRGISVQQLLRGVVAQAFAELE
jgi:hypothetical protein